MLTKLTKLNIMTELAPNLPMKVLAETIHKPWVRLSIFQSDVLKNVPEHYKKFHYDLHVVLPKPLYYNPKQVAYKMMNGVIHKQKDIPIPLYYPEEFENMLLGGEAVIEGISRPAGKKKLPYCEFYHIPRLYETVIYSEIFDKHFKAVVTPRFFKLVDAYTGFDNYIMKSRICELRTRLALRIKREMYLLMHKEPANEQLKDTFEKYKRYMIPFEEADWFGLTLDEAADKQQNIWDVERLNAMKPMKHLLREQYLEFLKSEEDLIKE